MSGPNLVRQVLSFSGVAAILLLMAPASLAGRNERHSGSTISSTLQAYTPPRDARRPSRAHTGGSVRGCGDDIVAIAPRFNAIGQTASTNPTFVWYNFSPDNDPIEFQLYRVLPDGSLDENEVLIKQFKTSKQGYQTFTLPAEADSLTVGETYMWQVVLYCDTAFENPGYYSSAELEVVELPAEVTSALTNSPSQRAQVYADAGLWYDALAEVVSDEIQATRASRQTLLLALADYEGQTTDDDAVEFITQLREISDVDDP